MSAQAVLSIMAPARPAATPRGSSDAGAPGFESLLATAVSDSDALPGAETGKATASAEPGTRDSDGPADSGAETAALEVPLTSPPVAPPPVKTGAEIGKSTVTDPPVLPGVAPSKEVEPLVLPGADSDTELQILTRPANARGGPSQTGPQAGTTKGAEPQVLPGAEAPKGLEPQVLPGEASNEVAPPVTGDADTTAARPVDVPAASAKANAPTPPTVIPPLRPLAERTSKPLDEAAKSAEAPSPSAEAKGLGPTVAAAPTRADQPARAAAPAAANVPSDQPVVAPAEAGPAGDPASMSAENAAPVREHALSTLSRATVDATAQIAAQILRKLDGRSTRFEIALRPDELGRVDVKLDIDSEGRLAARLAFDNPAAATDLRGRADELRRQLEAAGFQLADDAFEFTERDSGSSAFDRGQDARNGQSRAFAAAARLNNEIDVAQPPKWLALSLSPSGVDMKV